jgi:hypothetical protein
MNDVLLKDEFGIDVKGINRWLLGIYGMGATK